MDPRIREDDGQSQALTMATVLCVWEQGGNLGHLSNLRLPIEIALQLGHRVVLAARELHRVPEALGGLRIELLPAPFKQNVQPADQSAFLSFTHILARQCFSSVAELEMYLRAWSCIFDLVEPDLVLYDHSPTALVASHGRPFKKVSVGSGFYNPPAPGPGAPFAPFSTTALTPEVLTRLAIDEAQVLGMVNQARANLTLAPLAALADLYHQLDERLFLTWPELDHFGVRPGQRYLGNQALAVHPAAVWPAVRGPKVFGYLQNMPSLEALLRDLRASGVCALLWVNDLPPKLRQAYTSERLQFLSQLVDLSSVATQAHWAICHANHSTACTLMLAGLPQLLIPRHQEQLLLARRLVAQGSALLAYQDQPGYAKEINALLTNPTLRTNATALAHSCRQRGEPDAKGYIRAALTSLLVEVSPYNVGTVITLMSPMLTSNTLHPTKLIAIGNSKGIRLPQALLRRYGLGDQIMLEERPEGLLLRGAVSAKVSLKQTFAEMAQEQAAMVEDWSDLAAAEADGLDTLKW